MHCPRLLFIFTTILWSGLGEGKWMWAKKGFESTIQCSYQLFQTDSLLVIGKENMLGLQKFSRSSQSCNLVSVGTCLCGREWIRVAIKLRAGDSRKNLPFSQRLHWEPSVHLWASREQMKLPYSMHPSRSIWATLVLSFQGIRKREAAAWAHWSGDIRNWTWNLLCTRPDAKAQTHCRGFVKGLAGHTY